MIHPFALHPAIYWIGGVAVIGLAVSVYQADQEAEAAKALALAQSQPEAARLEGFDPNLHLGHDGELTLTAQIDLAQLHEVVAPHGLPPERRWVAPLYDTNAKAPDPAVDAMMLAPSKGFSADRLDALSEKTGPLGPVVTLNGRLVDPAPFEEAVVDAIALDGQVASPDVIYIEPFLHGRDAAFAPSPRGRAQALAIALGGALMLAYGVVWRWIRRRFVR